MSTSLNSSEGVDAGRPNQFLSVWSVISLVFFALAVAVPLLAFVLVPHRAVGPADAAGLTFVLFVSLAAEFACAVLGFITGWVGVRRSRGYPAWSRAGLALNCSLLLLHLVVPVVLLGGS
jgi:VIT1/CCC1 family predicted Fe2+/Mn2+ transporter